MYYRLLGSDPEKGEDLAYFRVGDNSGTIGDRASLEIEFGEFNLLFGRRWKAIALMTQDFLAHFSWTQFAFIALLYTLAPVLSSARWGRYRDINELMLAVKASPISACGIHLVFLGLLLAIFWIPAHHYSALPDWLKRASSLGPSVLDLAILVLFIVMVATEDRLIRSNSNEL